MNTVKSNSFQSITIVGICHKKEYASLKANLTKSIRDSEQIKIGVNLLPPLFFVAKLVTFPRHGLISKVFRFFRRCTSLLLKEPKLSMAGLSHFTLILEFTRNHEELVTRILSEHGRMYFSKFLYPNVNLMPNNLTLSHSQELDKGLKNFRVYWLYTKTTNSNIDALGKGSNLTKSFIEWESSNSPLKNDNSVEFLKIPYGNLKYLCLENATFAHGVCVYEKNKFYFMDSSRLNLPYDFKEGANPAYNSGEGIRILPFKVVRNIQEAILIGGTNNIMHFVLEDLLRLQKFESFISDNVPILINGLIHDNIINALRKLSRREILTCSSFEGITVEKLHTLIMRNPLPYAMHGNKEAMGQMFASASTNVGEFVNNKLKSRGELFEVTPLSRVAILRAEGLFRVMKNQNKLLSLLVENYGFFPIDPSKLAFDEIARKLQNTEVLIGQYGAGLANAIFLKPGSKVIQIKGPRDIDCLEYSALFDHLGLQEFIVEHRHKTISKILKAPGNFNVNLEKVKKTLDFL